MGRCTQFHSPRRLYLSVLKLVRAVKVLYMAAIRASMNCRNAPLNLPDDQFEPQTQAAK
jgi:hypothetical protein